MSTNTLKFLREYAEENHDAFKDGVTYVENRGFIDGFGVEAVLEGTAKQEFARAFTRILEMGELAISEGEDPEWENRIDYIVKGIDHVLKNTLLFNSSSFGSNALDMYKVREAQKLIEKLSWNRAMDKA